LRHHYAGLPLDNPTAAASALAGLQLLPLQNGTLAEFCNASSGHKSTTSVFMADETEELLLSSLGAFC
jgi:hypothetical protein